VRGRAHTLPSRFATVQEDWSAWLPAPKADAFNADVRHLELLYGMFSVSLNEAFELRRTGKAAHSCRAILVIPALCARLAVPLEGMLRTLGEHARHFGVVPNIAPLDPANFRGSREQHTARMSDLLSRVLFTQRSQFLHKIETLGEMVLSIRKNFCEVASDLGNAVSADPSADWRTLDEAHFDLNTCLREAVVLLKSFLVVLPNEQVAQFQKSINRHLLATPDPMPAAGRRMVAIERE
jgi:hypothetical protein